MFGRQRYALNKLKTIGHRHVITNAALLRDTKCTDVP